MTRTHAGLFGEVLDRQWRIEMLARPAEQRSEAPGRRLQFQERGELRLAAAAAVVEHELPRSFLRDLLAEILRDKRQRQIDAGGDPRRTPDVAVADENPVGLQLHLGIGIKKMPGALPMGGGTATVEQTCFGEDIGAGANAGDADAALCHSADECQRLLAPPP